MGNVWDALTRETRALKRRVERHEEATADEIAALKEDAEALERKIVEASKAPGGGTRAKAKADEED